MNTKSITKDTVGRKELISFVRFFVPLVLFVVNFSFVSLAHESRPGFLEIKQSSEETYDVLWKVPAPSPETRLVLNLRFPGDTQRLNPVTVSYMSGAFIERFSITRSGGLGEAEIYIEGLSRTLTDVLARVENLDGSVQTALLTPDKPLFVVEIAPSSSNVSQTYMMLGIQHILEGIDHLLFVACLLLVAGVSKKLLITITGFTLAHSITLILSSLQLVQIPVPPVEATIALSIIFLATEIVRKDKTGLTYRYPVAVSVSFGFLHGFGFAAVLNQIGLPQTDVPVALLFFNLGVEIGQLVFIGALLVLWRLVSHFLSALPKANPQTRFSIARFERLSAYAIGAASSFWFIERVVGFW